MPRPREFEADEALDVVMRAFWRRGFRATSVEDLVAATGVRAASLYGAFPGGKRGLFMRSLGRYSTLVVPAKLAELDDPAASLPQVRAYFDALVADLGTPEGRRGCLLVNSAVESGAEDDEVAAVVRGHLSRLESAIRDALERAVRNGQVRSTLDPTGAARMLVATSQGLMVMGKVDPGEEVLASIVDSAFAGLV